MRPAHPALRRTAAAVGLCATTIGLAVCAASPATAQVVTTWAASAPIPVGTYPGHLAVDPGTHRAYVTNNDGDGTLVNVIDTTTSTSEGTMSVQTAFPTDIEVDPATHSIFATSYSSGNITITGEDGTPGTTLSVTGASSLGTMSLDSADDTLYVDGTINTGNMFGNPVAIFAVNLADGTSTTVATIGQSMMGAPPLTVDPTSHTAYTGTGINTVVDLSTGTFASTPSLGGATALDPSRHELWTANGSGAASLVDTRTNKLVVTVPVGGSPSAIAVDQGAGLVYVTNSTNNSVSVIDENTYAVLATVPVDAGPAAVAVDPSSHDVTVVNSGARTVSTIHMGSADVSKPQVVHFTSTVPANAYVQGTYTATATGGDSGNRVLFSTDPQSHGGCYVSLRGVVVFATTGTCIVDADQDGAGLWNDAPTAKQTIHVVQRTQAITFPALKALRVGQKQALRASSSARLPVTYTVRTPKTCTVSRGYVVAKTAGSCGVTANAAGTAAYAKAVAKSATFTVTRYGSAGA